MRSTLFLLLAFMLTLTACGGGGDGSFNRTSTGNNEKIVNLSITVSIPTGILPADGLSQATLSFLSTDEKGAAVGNQTISLSFSSASEAAFGTLSATSVTTDAQGRATATFTTSKTPGTANIRIVLGSEIDVTETLTSVAPALSRLTLSSLLINGNYFLEVNAFSKSNLNQEFALEKTEVQLAAITGAIGGKVCANPQNVRIAPANIVTNQSGFADAVVTATQGGDYCISADVNSQSVAKLLLTIADDVVPVTLNILLNKPTLNTGKSDKVIATVLVRDQNNNILPNANVRFAVDSGELLVTRATTDAAGTAEAEITSRTDLRNRSITLTVEVNKQTKTLSIPVQGTRLDIGNLSAQLLPGSPRTVEVTLLDGNNDPVANQFINIRETNTPGILAIAPTQIATNARGTATFQLQGTTAGVTTLEIAAPSVGVQEQFVIRVDDSGFILNIPGASGGSAQLPIDQKNQLVLIWQENQNFVNGKATFTTTRGQFFDLQNNPAGNSITVDVLNGVAVVNIRSDSAGLATITVTGQSAQVPVTPSESREVLFVSQNPKVLAVTISPDSIPAGGSKAQIRALVTDLNNNPVKDARVSFNLTDPTGGTLNNGSRLTDQNGVAVVTYTSGTNASAKDGVKISVSVLNPDGTVAVGPVERFFTVNNQELFVRLGTSRDIVTTSNTLYSDPWTVIVTDSGGNGLANSTVRLRVIPEFYRKGYWRKDPPAPENFKLWAFETTATCPNEDLDRDGILDPGEDTNNNNVLDPGNVTSAPSTIITADGTSNLPVGIQDFLITYPKDRGATVDVTLEASAAVTGSEFKTSAFFTLDVSVTDLTDENSPPPPSPYGRSATCTCNLADEALAAIEKQKGLPFTRPECEPLP
jgi:protocatechuate 3,4-dioxygenase beta subunit